MVSHVGEIGSPSGNRKGVRQMEDRDRAFEARLDAVGWGLLFVVVGAVLLIPDLPDGTWLTAVGAVMVGVSLVRFAVGLPIGWTTAIVGIAALVAGVCQVAGLESMAGPLALVVVGITLIGSAAVRIERPARFTSNRREAAPLEPTHGEGR
jgi:hypothetical protein